MSNDESFEYWNNPFLYSLACAPISSFLLKKYVDTLLRGIGTTGKRKKCTKKNNSYKRGIIKRRSFKGFLYKNMRFMFTLSRSVSNALAFNVGITFFIRQQRNSYWPCHGDETVPLHPRRSVLERLLFLINYYNVIYTVYRQPTISKIVIPTIEVWSLSAAACVDDNEWNLQK